MGSVNDDRHRRVLRDLRIIGLVYLLIAIVLVTYNVFAIIVMFNR